MVTKYEHALSLAEMGFYVFRLRKNEKLPYAKGWQEEATTDPEEIAALFGDRDFNIGIFTGKYAGPDTTTLSCLVVVDVDTKEGKQGLATMREQDALGNDMPPTLAATTASGGKHYIYQHTEPTRGGVNKVGLNVDVKASGGYIVAPGSTINNAPYTFEQPELPVAPAPAWLIARCGKPTAKSALIQATDFLDTEQAIDRAIDYLLNTAPDAIKGQGRNNQLYKVACVCSDFGCSEPVTLELMWQHYNPTKVFPAGYDFERLAQVVSNAIQFKENPAGANSPNNGTFEAMPDTDDTTDTDTPQPKAPKLFLEWFDSITTPPDTAPLIENLLDQQAMSILYGESNTGKTFVAMDIAYHIAAGLPWDNRRTLQGPVLYLAAEGGKAARNRIVALKNKYQPAPNLPFALIPCSINLFDSKADLVALVELIKSALKSQRPRLLVIDTLSRVLAGGNENSSEDMTQFIENIDTLRRVLGCHALIVHHSGKDTSKGARGHSSLRAATDTELEIVDNAILTRKQRDMEFSTPIGFELSTVIVGANAYGKDVTSCTVSLVPYDPKRLADANRMEPRDLAAWLALQFCKTGRNLREYTNVVDQKTWAQCCKDFDMTTVPGAAPWPKSRTSFNNAFERARGRLTTLERVLEIEDGQWVALERPRGEAATSG